MEERLSRSLSIFQRQRSGRGNGFLAATLPRPYNTENLLNDEPRRQQNGPIVMPRKHQLKQRIFGRAMILSMLALALIVSGCASRRPQTTAPATAPQPSAPSTSRPALPSTGARQTPATATPDEYTEQGVASWYGPQFNGRRTSDGEVYDMYQLTAAHRTLPFNAVVRVTNLRNGKQVNVRINDRGPFVANRIIDLSYSAAEAIGMVGPGTAEVRLDVMAGPDPNLGFFGVQVGAFQVKENAERLQRQLSVRYTPVTIAEFDSPNDVFYRVRAGRLPSEAAAHELATQLQQQDGAVAFVVRLDE